MAAPAPNRDCLQLTENERGQIINKSFYYIQFYKNGVNVLNIHSHRMSTVTSNWNLRYFIKFYFLITN